MARIPPQLGTPVTSRDFSWNDMVQRAWGSEFHAPDHDIYKWSNGRGFDSTDMYKTGIYNGGIVDPGGIVIEPPTYPDMFAGYLQTENFDKLVLD